MKHTYLIQLIISFFLSYIFTSTSIFAQAPSQSDAVMLQGFYWDSNSTTSWSKLHRISGEISGNFDIVWLPPSAFSSGGTGYMPKQWSNQNSDWGSAGQLKTLIEALKANNCRTMADVVVNHRDGKSSWVDFYEDDFGSYGKFQLTKKHICRNDEAVTKGHLSASEAGNTDTGDNFDGTRDLDHTNSYVQDAIKAYLKWMKGELKYDGWRYDMVKGFGASYIKDYNVAGNAYMSVGEYWDGNYDAVWAWIKGTGQTSTAFDFPMKYAALNNGLAGNNYSAMAWSDNGTQRPAGLIHSPQSRRYAVTFVDNHDTYRDGSKYIGDVLKANAFILSSPGIPCVFYPHWNANKAAINGMIKARKSIGLHNESVVEVQNTNGYYKAYSIGKCGEMLTYIGSSNSSWSSDAPSGGGWTLATSGSGWAMYTKLSSTSCADEHQAGLDNGSDPEPQPTFTSATITATVPTSWTNPKIHVWNSQSASEEQITKAAWPGDAMTKVEANKYTITLSEFSPTNEIGIVINNGAATSALQTIDVFATTANSCWILSSTAIAGGKYDATEDTSCQPTGLNTPKQTSISVYPNPVSDFLTIKNTEKEINQIKLLSLSGQEILSTKETILNVSNFNNGVYLLQIHFSDNSTAFSKIIKQ